MKNMKLFSVLFLASCLMFSSTLAEDRSTVISYVEDYEMEEMTSGDVSFVSGSLNLPVHTTVIEDYAFYGCMSLYGSLIIPDQVVKIGDYAFANCNRLTGKLVIPDSVQSIGEGAFEGCDHLLQVNLYLIHPDGLSTTIKRTAVYCSKGSYAWKWAWEQDDFEPVELMQTDTSDWPKRAIELIVPANPGGDTDANARALAAALKEELGWDVIVTNMVGGSGSVAFEDALINPNDGYRFVFYHNGGITSELMGMYDFSIIDDFKLAGMPFMDYSNAFLINAENPNFNDVNSMVEYMKANPNSVTFATETGTFTHLQVLAFESAAGVKFNIVDAYTNAQKITELLGKRLDVISMQASLVRDYLTTNQFICLGAFSENSIQMGNVELKSFREQGYDFVFPKFFYLAAPNAVDDEVISKMNEGLAKVAHNGTLQAYAANALLQFSSMTPEETEAYYIEQKDIYFGYLADYID